MKAKRRTEAKRKLYTPPSEQKMGPIPYSLFSEEEQLFWIGHGINCIVSDYKAGTWTPLLEGLYEGKAPSPEDMVKAILAKYGTEADTKWPPEAKAALAWTVQPREVCFIYKTECVRRLEAKDVEDAETEARKPHNSTVWDVFDELKLKLVQRKSI